MSTNTYSQYPIYLQLKGKSALVVGAGSVGLRKIKSLNNSDIDSITVVDPFANFDNFELKNSSKIITMKKQFEASDINNKFLVFACTDNVLVNSSIANVCKEANVLCNIADSPLLSDFYVPASFAKGNVSVAISTGGTSPALAKKLREELENWLDVDSVNLSIVLERLRPILLDLKLPTDENTKIFRFISSSSLGKILSDKNNEFAVALLKEILPTSLHKNIGELISGF